MLRIVLFLATNLAVLFMAAIAMAVLTALGIIPPDAPYISMLVWCALFGFGGSILSLAMSSVYLYVRYIAARYSAEDQMVSATRPPWHLRISGRPWLLKPAINPPRRARAFPPSSRAASASPSTGVP